MWSKPSTMTLSDDVLCVDDEHNRVKYRILKISSHHFDGLKEMIRDQLAEVCYGAEPIAIEPDQYTYHAACRQMYNNLMRYKDETKKYGLVGELLMHILAPNYLDFSAESISRIFALQNQNIKQGFDLIFYDKDCKKIWYGEVKSGLVGKANRRELINKASNGLKNYFDNIMAEGNDSTQYRWEAAKAEVAVMFASEKKIELIKLLSNSKNMIRQRKGFNRNAILMAVNFGDFAYNITDTKDVIKKIDSIKKTGCFDNFIIICIHRKIFDDIIDFLGAEGGV
ncbi:DUF1837 domain-containing protein [Candidatus Saccharibacteria bacterium oral taxon 488]|nr:DUF1837 domain-containing protein [Candidatus Saccharibacteria bacterium oral taxon 488]